jgi:aryl-alcohol dehydrogenase-like predicted oxidoreductase
MTQIPAMGPVIAACTTPEQCAENAAAGKVVLSAEQVQAVAQLVQ